MIDVNLPDGQNVIDIEKMLNDIEIQSAQLDTLKEELQNLSASFEEELKMYQSDFKNFQNEIKTSLGNATSDAASISNTLKNVRQSEADISKIKTEINNVSIKYNEHTEQYSELINLVNEEYKALTGNINKEKEELVTLRKELSDERIKISKILGDANRASMAQSFLERKSELNTPIENTSKWRNWGLILMTGVMLYILQQEWTMGFDYTRFLSRLPIVAPLIWLIWVNTQRNAHLVRIQEAYAHKASVALAFEGYQRKIDESKELEIKKLLLELSVANLGENPVHLFDKQVKSSPMDDSIISKLLEKAFPKNNK